MKQAKSVGFYFLLYLTYLIYLCVVRSIRKLKNKYANKETIIFREFNECSNRLLNIIILFIYHISNFRNRK